MAKAGGALANVSAEMKKDLRRLQAERLAGLKKLIRAAAYEFAEAGPLTSALKWDRLWALVEEYAEAKR